MSATEAAGTRDARGWLYSGVCPNHHDPMPELEINDSDCKVWKPCPSSVWKPHEPKSNIRFPTNACTADNIALCDYMRQMNTTLSAEEMIDLGDLVQFLIRIKQDVASWHQTLASFLEVNGLDSGKIDHPAILQLHMQYFAILIFPYQPYLSCQLASQRAALDTAENQAAMRSIAGDCVAAARQVTELLRYYKKQHSFRRANVQIVHIILTASLIFIHDLVAEDNVKALGFQTVRQAKACFYKRAKLLDSAQVQADYISMSRIALLLTS
ncbi:hypothetical protein G7046_g2284 [Stylonectria norvegica]|nr:hypothetical protein G7046_g2284 [Stylonectria norvegica]